MHGGGRRTAPGAWLGTTAWLIALVAIAVHAGSLRGEFLEWDDVLLVARNPRVLAGGFSDVVEMLTPSGARELYGSEYLPVRDLSTRLDRLVWGMDPVGYHLGNVLLFGVAAAALHGVLLELFRDRRAAVFGALLFAVHPVATESVACIAHRKDVLMAALGLLAWLAWLREKRVLAVVLFAGAVLSKLPAIALPAVFLLTDVATGRRFDVRRVVGVCALLAVAAAATAVSLSIAPALRGATWHGGTPLTNALSVGVAFLESARLLLFPVGLHVGRVNETMTRTAPDTASLAGLLLLAGLLAVGVVALVRQRRRPSTGGVVLVLATLGLLAIQAPYLQVRPFWVLFAERYLILALVPVSIAVGYLVSLRRGQATTLAAVAGLALLAGLTWHRETAWKDTRTLFTDAFEKEPRSYIAYDKVGRLDYLAGRTERGHELLRRAVEAAEELRPLGQALLEQILVSARQDLINSSLDLGRIDEARELAANWVRERPDSYVAHAFVGFVEHRARRPDAAEAGYRTAIRLATEQGAAIPMAHENLGFLYRDLEGTGSDASMAELERAVAADPRLVTAWEELARGHAAHGRWDAVADCYRSALRARPGDPRIVETLAAVLEQRLGRVDEARELRSGVGR